MYAHRLPVLSLLLAGAFAPFAHAAAEADGADEHVTVRAGFRATDLMRDAGSVTVLDPGVIAERGATHLDQTLAVAPNVTFAGGGSRARFIQMRGIGDLEQFVDPKHFYITCFADSINNNWFLRKFRTENIQIVSFCCKENIF